jgi:hypothetical protein
MTPVRRILPVAAAFALFAACILSVTRSSAGVPPQVQTITDDTPVPVEAVTGVCTVEPAPPGATSYTFGAGRWRDLVWRIHPGACEACPFPQALAMESVAFRVRWLGKCTAQVELTIIGATGPAACPQPDTTNVLCGPTLHPIESDAFAGLKTHTLPILGSCCISQDAFVRIRFVNLLCDDAQVTEFAVNGTTTPCSNCEQYFGTTAFFGGLSDWCAALNGGVNSVWTRYTANCCAPVPTVPRSWGQVKTLYR